MVIIKQLDSGQSRLSSIAEKMSVTDMKAAYDENVKWLLSEKILLAHIMTYAVKEYKDMDPWEVCDLIEGEPQVGSAGVTPGSSAIIGDNVEDAVPNEGKITYDIRFHAWAPERDKMIELIIDIEAQRKYYPGYDLVTRGIFYGARMISAQLGTEFTASDYDSVKKVYSIWICMDSPQYAENTVTEYGIRQNNIVGSFPKGKARYDLMSVLMICLPRKLADRGNSTRVHRLLGTLLSSTLTSQEKKTIIEEEYGIFMTQRMERSEKLMCNLSEAIEERGLEQGLEKGEALRLVKSIEANMRNFHIDLETACTGNEVTVEEYLKAKECCDFEGKDMSL